MDWLRPEADPIFPTSGNRHLSIDESKTDVGSLPLHVVERTDVDADTFRLCALSFRGSNLFLELCPADDDYSASHPRGALYTHFDV